jgi:L-2-hydroxyglutarate oxidase
MITDPRMDQTCDVAIIGGGLVGLATALALVEASAAAGADRGSSGESGGDNAPRDIVLLEAEPDLAAHQSGHNSGVIHAGLYYRPGSLKARTCAEGRAELLDFCAQEGIATRICGKLVVATRSVELPRLRELRERGIANGLDGLRLLGPAGAREIEPEVACLAALHVPQTGVVDYRLVAAAMGRRLRDAGVRIHTGSRVVGCRREGDEIVLTVATPRASSGGADAGDVAHAADPAQVTPRYGAAGGPEDATAILHCRRLVACAGLQADRVARLCGLQPDVRIVPFRGEYFALRPERASLVRGLIYPVPDPGLPFLGVHLTRTIDDRVEAGPNAVLALARHGYRRRDIDVRDLAETLRWPGLWRLAVRYGRVGLAEQLRSLSPRAFTRAARRLVPALRDTDLAPAGAGVRAQALDREGRLLDDFHLLEAPGMVHVLNAPSPAATASLAIGRRIAERLLAQTASQGRTEHGSTVTDSL